MPMPTDADRAALSVAFAAPANRPPTETATSPRDRIALREHVREVEIGAFLSEEERLALYGELNDALRTARAG